MPSLNATVSKSGAIAANIPAAINRGEMVLRPNARPSASGTTAWVKMVGIVVDQG